jgi:alpha-tubulin suppressor-like RCC1 family protein/predicted RNA-binding protein with RPS1 domain
MDYQLTITPKDKPYNEIQNYAAFAAIKSDGSVVAWGNSDFGGTAPNITDVKQIFSSGFAFAALKNDGSVVSWGTDGNNSPINTPNMTNVKTISSTESAFAALTNDGQVVTWGNTVNDAVVSSLTNVKEIYSNNYAFAALKNDGSVVTWGDGAKGGDSSNDLSKLDGTVDVIKIFSTKEAFAALKTDGSVVAWGSNSSVPVSISNPSNQDFIPVKEVYASDGAFAAFREDGSVVFWGDSYGGGYSDDVTLAALNDSTKKVVNIFSNSGSFVALREDHSVVRWGGYSAGLDVIENISKIFSSGNSFAAITDNGSVITWGIGESDYGGDSSNVSSQLNDQSNPVITIYSTFWAFAALRQDGSVVTWGDGVSGGDSSSVATQINDINNPNFKPVSKIFTTSWGTFAALRNDGSVVTWGDSNALSSQSDIVSIANATTDDNYVLAPLPILPPTPSTPTPPQPVVIENHAPTGSVSISGTPSQGQVLTVSNTLADANGMGAVSYQWFNNSGAIQNATQTTYTLTQADVGKTFSVTASYMDYEGFSASVVSSSTMAVANINDAPTGAVFITGTATQGQVLTASNTLADLDGIGTVSYQWQRSGSDIPSATQSTYVLTQNDVDKTISVKASYIDKFDAHESVSSAVTAKIVNVNDTPTGTISILGTATQNQTLIANIDTVVDLDGIGDISYQWQRSGSEILSATQSTYVLTQTDVDKTISVKANYIDKFGASESVGSAATAKIVDVNDKPSGRVSLSGTPAQNHTLTASNDLSDLDGLGPISYQWLRNNNAILNATQATYALTQIDVGNVVSVKASFTDGLGNLEDVIGGFFSPGLDPLTIANENDLPKGNVSITGMAKKGHVLSASNTLTDIDGLGEIHYQWLNEGNVIANADQASYELTQEDVGKNISVKASYTDLQKTNESMTSSAMLISANKAPTGAITLKGSPVWGATLTASSTLKDADGLGKLSYSWQNGAGELSTSPSYKLGEDAIDTNVWLTVHYTDKKGNIEEVNSKPVDVTISKKSSAYNDILKGTAVADKLSGLSGNDTLVGGAGSDRLTGGKGSDIFVFTASDFYTADSNDGLVLNSAVDTVADFNVKEHDVLDFGDLGELSFYPSLNDAQDELAKLFYVKGSGKIYLNTNEDGGFTPTVIVVLTGKPAVNTDLTDWNYPAV